MAKLSRFWVLDSFRLFSLAKVEVQSFVTRRIHTGPMHRPRMRQMVADAVRLLAFILGLPLCAADPPQRITHSFLACGTETYILDGSGKVTWRYPRGSRDGWVLPSGHVLLAISRSNEYPGGAAVEVTRDG